MDFLCFARNGTEEKQIPLIDKEGTIVCYLRETIKDILKYHKWDLSAEMFCHNTGIECDALILKAVIDGQETTRYQIHHFCVCAQESEMLVTLKTQNISANSSQIEMLAFVFISIRKDERGQVVKIDNPTRLIFPSARQPTHEPH